MNKELTGHLIAFGTVFIWGITFVSTKILLTSFTPAEILFIRFSLGFAALFIIYPKFAPVYNIKNELLFILAGLFGIFLYLILENTALSYTLASNVGLLVSISPFISALLAYLFLKDEKLKPFFFLGIVLALCGTAMIIFNETIVLELNPIGDILALFAAASWAVYSLFVKKISFLNIHPIQSTRKIFFLWSAFYPSISIMDRNKSRYESIYNTQQYFKPYVFRLWGICIMFCNMVSGSQNSRNSQNKYLYLFHTCYDCYIFNYHIR